MGTADLKLSPGPAFLLGPDGKWEVSEVPKSVLETAVQSGHLTIDGVRTIVFEDDDKNMWAQKAVSTVSSKTTSIWTRPILDDCVAEIQLMCDQLSLDPVSIVDSFKKSSLRTLSEDNWSKLVGSPNSYSIKSIDQARRISNSEGRDIESIIEAIGDGESMPAPVIIEDSKGTPHLVDGETRLMAARAFKMNPKVLWIKAEPDLASIAAKVANARF